MHDFNIIMEMMASKEEQALLFDLQKSPYDTSLRSVYADWLLDQGRERAARLVRDGYTPGVGWTRYMCSGAICSGYGPALSSGVIFSGSIGCHPISLIVCGNISMPVVAPHSGWMWAS